MEAVSMVSGSSFLDLLIMLAEQGVNIRVLINSLEATDVAIVHAGYAKRRKPLLKAGITSMNYAGYRRILGKIQTPDRSAVPLQAFMPKPPQ